MSAPNRDEGNLAFVAQSLPARLDPREQKEILKHIEDLAAVRALRRLVKWGCERGILEAFLFRIGRISRVRPLALPLRRRKAMSRRIHRCAKDFEYLVRRFSFLLPSFNAFMIPVVLRQTAEQLEDAANQSRPRARRSPIFHDAVALLVSYVKRCTRRPYDSQLARVLNVACQKRAFPTAGSLKTWRREHHQLIVAAARHVQQLRSRRPS